MRILAIDLGRARTGVAICDERECLASPVGTIAEHNTDRLLERVTALVAEQNAARVVVGLPRNMDGTQGESAQRAQAFASALAERTGLPVDLWDERLTTVSAIGFLNQTNVRGKKRKAVVDTVSAVIILQDYLDRRHAQEPSCP